MGIAERRLRQKGEMRQNILNAAWQLVQTDGWSALSIRKIADAIEYSVPVIYHHFDNKDAILLAFTREGFRLLTERVAEAQKQAPQPARQLELIAHAYWDFAFSNPEYYQLMFGLGIPTCETVNTIAEVKGFTDIILEVVQQAMARSHRPEADHWLKFRTYWSILHGLVSIRMISNQPKADADDLRVLQDAIAGFIKAL